MDEEYESVSLVKPEIFVYRIPPLGTNRGHKAADWKLDAPDWTGRMKLVAIGKRLELRLEDKSTGALYAKCPIDAFPGVCIEPVTDSSRYFVILLKNDAGQTAFDHFKYIEKSAELEQQINVPQPSLDLAFKEGQTISIKLKKGPDGQPLPARSRPQPAPVGGSVPLLPPPPGGSAPSGQPNPAAVRRLQRDYEKLRREPIDGIEAVPDDANILVWHYVIKGSPDTPYEGGYYYGKILFQPDFPWKPPAICMLTPNGRASRSGCTVMLTSRLRFQTNMRLCLSISDYHPESWNPGWTVSSILVGLHSFMNEESHAAGVINEPFSKRRKYAAESMAWNLAYPGFKTLFPSIVAERDNVTTKNSSASSSRSNSSTNQSSGATNSLNSKWDKAPNTHAQTGGVYHGKLVFPSDFPFKPPSIYMITPSGRFQVNTRLCLSISDFHPDTWNPAWTVSTIITGLLSFMNDTAPTLANTAEEATLREEEERLRSAAEPSSGLSSLVSNLIVIAGVVVLAFAVRYMIHAAQEQDSHYK
ncbi:ubiquitin--protein ligase [Ostertagia ostertagi]